MARDVSTDDVLRVACPVPLVDAVDRAAHSTGQTRSATVRELLMFALRERSLWPPPVRGAK